VRSGAHALSQRGLPGSCRNASTPALRAMVCPRGEVPISSGFTLGTVGAIMGRAPVPEWQAAMDHSLSSRTLNPSMSANAIAYDFCACRVGRYVKRKLRPTSSDPLLLSPTSAIPCPCSEGGSMTIAKGRVSIFAFPRFYVTAQYREFSSKGRH
jgi:hypothetical protein